MKIPDSVELMRLAPKNSRQPNLRIEYQIPSRLTNQQNELNLTEQYGRLTAGANTFGRAGNQGYFGGRAPGGGRSSLPASFSVVFAGAPEMEPDALLGPEAADCFSVEANSTGV